MATAKPTLRYKESRKEKQKVKTLFLSRIKIKLIGSDAVIITIGSMMLAGENCRVGALSGL